jgi:hypothetical protein
LLSAYLGLARKDREPLDSPGALAAFLQTRSSVVAQASLYGYLRTRAGTRYPELFDDDPFVVSINIAKWHVWLACLSDLAVYAGGRLAQAQPADAARVGALLRELVAGLLETTGVPPDAGEDYPRHVAQVVARLARCDWLAVGDGEEAFSESPAALVRWAPIVDELKQLDEEIVRNSVRFRWHEIRRELRRDLDAAAVLAVPSSPASR